MRSYNPHADHPDAQFIPGSDSLAPCFSAGGSHVLPLAHGLVWDPTQFKGHAITFGMTGEGKGVSAINPAALSYAGSMLIFDPKGATAWETIPRRRQLGQKVVLLDPWNEVNERYGSQVGILEETSSYNPLAHLRPDSPDFSDDVTMIADALIIPNAKDPHWTESARLFISGLIAAVVELAPGFATLDHVRQHISSEDDKLPELLAQAIKENPKSLAARKLRRFAEGGKEVRSIRSTADTQTAILDAVRLLSSMETVENAFDMSELASGRVTIYLVLPVDKFETHGRWLRLMLAMALRAVARYPRPPALPVLFVCDELGTIGPLRALENAYGLLRSAGVRCWSFLQDISQLQRDYPESWRTFIANSHVVQVLQASEPATTSYISGMLGYRTEKKTSQFTIDLIGRQGRERVVPKDPEHYKKWQAQQRAREKWELDVVTTTNRRQRFELYGTSHVEHPERHYPGPWALEKTEFPPDFATSHDEFKEIPLMRPQDIADMADEAVLIIFQKRGKYRLRRVVHFKESGWQQYIRPNPAENLDAALAYARSRPASAPRALPAPAFALSAPERLPALAIAAPPVLDPDVAAILTGQQHTALRNWMPPAPRPPRPPLPSRAVLEPQKSDIFLDRWAMAVGNSLPDWAWYRLRGWLDRVLDD